MSETEDNETSKNIEKKNLSGERKIKEKTESKYNLKGEVEKAMPETDQNLLKSKSENYDISVPCQKHPNKTIEYICVEKACQEKVFCTTCIFRQDYCRHQNYTRDLTEFLDEQKKQYERLPPPEKGFLEHIFFLIGLR